VSSEADRIVQAAVEQIVSALGLPAELVLPIIDLIETVAHAPDVLTAIRRAKQNALADAEDAAAEVAADRIIKGLL
jgi:hypothetical protein